MATTKPPVSDERKLVSGAEALATWESMRAAGRGCPLVLGGDMIGWDLTIGMDEEPVTANKIAQTLASAGKIRFPDDLYRMRREEEATAAEFMAREFGESKKWLPRVNQIDEFGRIKELSPEKVEEMFLEADGQAPVGDWPDEVSEPPGLTVAQDVMTSKWLSKVEVVLVPTQDWTEIPAFLQWGGWNECPHPEYHVAALRSWRERYGAQLVGIDRATFNLRVERRPTTRDEALALAREQYSYCFDIVDQGVQTLSQLAADLMDQEWWYFWWD